MSIHVSCLTPPGTAALATLAVHGEGAWALMRDLFRPALPEEPQAGKFWLGRLGDDLGRDEVVLAAKSDMLMEIHCHGGRQVVLWIEDILMGRGAVRSTALEFKRYAGWPTWQAAVLDGVSRAPTLRTASILLDQYHGAMARALAEIDAHVEQDRLERARSLQSQLRARIPLGQHLVAPWRVVIVGAVNAGKSSLVNALAGHTRSVVSHVPGTTRDVLTTRIALDGWPIELVDTAGWRDSDDSLEQAGIARAWAALERADLVVWLLNGSTEPVLPEAALPTALYVLNKIDLPDVEPARADVRISARTGEGLPELCRKIVERLVPDPPEPGAAVPFTREDQDRLLQCKE